MYNLSQADKIEIDKTTKIFFEIFTNKDHRIPDWEIIKSICIPGAMIIKKTEDTEEVYTLDTFIGPRKKILTDGTLTDFEEMEISEETRITGNIAQRYSRYQKSGYLQGSWFKAHGNKFFQFIKTNNGWKINSLIWEDD